MKKILLITAIALSTNFVFGQEGGNELKNFRFGLKVTPSIDWYKPDGKILKGNGPVVKFGGGLVTEFRLAKVVSILTGIQLDMDGGKIIYRNGGISNPSTNTVSYYYYIPDDKIVKYDPVLSASPSSNTHYQVNERSYSVTYITIPLALKMKTKEIGALTYYGQIGMNNSFRWKATADDKLTVINDITHELGATDSKSKIDVNDDVSLYMASLNFGLGAELNFSGSTSLVFGLNYNLGFTSVVKSESGYIERRVNDGAGVGTFTQLPQTIKSNAVVLTVGVLF